MRKRIFLLIMAALLMISLCACDIDILFDQAQPQSDATPSRPTEIPDLTGEWVQTDTNPDGSRQAAYISEDTIEVYWISGGSTDLYWSGSFSPPFAPTNFYTWNSTSNTGQTETAPLASQSTEKNFRYKDGMIYYFVNELEETRNIELGKEAWGYSGPALAAPVEPVSGDAPDTTTEGEAPPGVEASPEEQPEPEPEPEPEPTAPATPAPSDQSGAGSSSGGSSGSEPSTTGAYVGSINSTIFHEPACPSAQNINRENEVWFATRAEAIADGREPCENCDP